MKKRLAQIISFVFHPVIFSLLAPFLVIYKYSNNVFYGIEWMGFSALFLILVLAIFYVVRPKEFFSDFDITHKEKRHIFYSIALLVAVLYFIISLIFKGIFFPLSLVALGIILGLVIFDIATYYMKVSIHTAIVCAYAITAGILYGLAPFIIGIAILVAVGWSRILLKRHTKQEVLAGIILGAAVTFITLFVSKFLLR